MHPHNRFRNFTEKTSPKIHTTSCSSPKYRTSKRFDPEAAMAKQAFHEELPLPPLKPLPVAKHDVKTFFQENVKRLIQMIQRWMAQ